MRVSRAQKSSFSCNMDLVRQLSSRSVCTQTLSGGPVLPQLHCGQAAVSSATADKLRVHTPFAADSDSCGGCLTSNRIHTMNVGLLGVRY